VYVDFYICAGVHRPYIIYSNFTPQKLHKTKIISKN
jgi:hypothetical protein